MWLTACQPVPQPFQPAPASKTENPLLVLPDRAGVVVLPVDGIPGGGPDALAHEMALALVDSFEDTELPAGDPQSVTTVSDSIFSQYIVPFEAVSVLLLAALIGAIVVARQD